MIQTCYSEGSKLSFEPWLFLSAEFLSGARDRLKVSKKWTGKIAPNKDWKMSLNVLKRKRSWGGNITKSYNLYCRVEGFFSYFSWEPSLISYICIPDIRTGLEQSWFIPCGFGRRIRYELELVFDRKPGGQPIFGAFCDFQTLASYIDPCHCLIL